MAFVKFMRNKFFHPHTYENQKRTWIAEQKHEAEKKAQEELHKQYLKEQSIYENKNLLKHGKLTQDEKLSFMYEPPLQCRKKDEKLELREVRFEWQKNAPREGNYAKNLDVADRPFGIEVRNTKCIKCGVWGHMNTDKICPLYNRGMNTEENPPDLGKEDPMSLLNSMEKGGLKMRKHAVNSVMDVHDNKYKMLEDEKLDPEIAFIANLTDKQKRKLMKKLNKNGGASGGVAKAKHKKKKMKKEKKKKKRKKEDETSSEVECKRQRSLTPPPAREMNRVGYSKNRDEEKNVDNRGSYRKSPRRHRRSSTPKRRRRSRSKSPKPGTSERRASIRSRDHIKPTRRSRSPNRREGRDKSRSPESSKFGRSRCRSGRHSPSPYKKRGSRQILKEKQRNESKSNVRHESTDSSDPETLKSKPRRVSSSSTKNNNFSSQSRKQRHDTESSDSDSDCNTTSQSRKNHSKHLPQSKGKEKKRPIPQSPSDSEPSSARKVRHDTPSDSSSDSDSDHKPSKEKLSRGGKGKGKARRHSSSSSSD